ncbi:MAG: TRZ/ATZ family hydrolase [Pseudomonadota bacterium]|nr:TRZ/ATZ family hydrolase [Pseudomonadota bacterium]
MPPQAIDLLISARWIIPVIPDNAVYSDCALAVDGGRILGIHPSAEARRLYAPRETVALDSHALIPGLINAHGHLAMSLLRGYADDYPLDTWLKDHIWPAEGRWVGEEFVRDGAELAMAEMLKSGTTCFSDMYFFPEQVALAARQHGLRCQLAFPILNFPSAWARNGDEYISKGLALRDTYKADDLINVIFGPHAPYTVDDRYFDRIATYANELDTGIQIHLHETQAEVDEALAQSGERPIARLQRLGILTPNTQCVHMTAVNDDDIALLAASGAQVVHCPKSNLKLASGFCPEHRLREAGINVALGTDGAASNNSLDLFSEMVFASLLSKGLSGNAAALDTHASLRMATLNGARALGIDAITGSLEVGKAADLVAVDLGGISREPMYNPLSQLVHTPVGHRVSDVWVNGAAKVRHGQLQSFSEQELETKARQWRDRILG